MRYGGGRVAREINTWPVGVVAAAWIRGRSKFWFWWVSHRRRGGAVDSRAAEAGVGKMH